MSEKKKQTQVTGDKYYLLRIHNDVKLHFPAEVFLMN